MQGKKTILIFLAFFLAQAIGGAVCNAAGVAQEEAYLWATVLSTIMVVALSLMLKEKLRLTGRPAAIDVRVIGMGASFAIIVMMAEYFFASADPGPSPVSAFIDSSSIPFRGAWVACAVLLGPLAEEIMFRHFLLGFLLARFSPVLSVLLSSLAFVLPHLLQTTQMHAIAGIFLLGIFCGAIRARQGTIRLSVAFHAAYNLTICAWVMASHSLFVSQ